MTCGRVFSETIWVSAQNSELQSELEPGRSPESELNCPEKEPEWRFLVNLFLIKLVRISGFSSLFTAIAVFLALSGKM